MTTDPIVTFNEIFSRARSAEGLSYDAAALATAGADSGPAVRMVLVKQADERGFVFYTNDRSRKGRELAGDARAALCFWWPRLRTQIRIEGIVERIDDSEADAYFATRPRDSQIGAWVSRQSEPLPSYDDLVRSAEEVSKRFGNREIPRPPHWSGFRVRPRAIEFWYERPGRLHERHLYSRTDGRWVHTLLQP
jgi:pyridoxamine 5'-phosphate oxidase